jgi:hypothetical protein
MPSSRFRLRERKEAAVDEIIPIEEDEEDDEDDNQFENINGNTQISLEPRKSTIKFNPQPSILEFDNAESEIKLESNEVVDLEFEEL